MNIKAKVALTVAVIAGGVGYMIYTTVSSGEALEYYKQVDEVMATPGTWQDRRIKLHGNVVTGSILKKQGSLDFRFALHREGKWVDVVYRGLVPDAFKDCAELVVTGTFSDGMIFEAEGISAKCPSKYDQNRQTGCGEGLAAAVTARRSQGGEGRP